MILSTKLLNLLGILTIGSISLEVAVAVDDLDDTLKEALFLVKLLKSDIAQILRTNDGVLANSTEEENSTCSLPSEEFNSTMAMNETEVTASLVTTSTPASRPPPTPVAPPAPPNVMPPGAPMMMPYVSWPPLAMGYPPPSGPGRQNFPDENYRFPYRRNRRRMMPDYYYFDPPAKSRGNFRRFGNDPADDPPATSQAQTTSSVSPATIEATTLHVEETTASTTSLPTTLAQPSTSILPTTEQPMLRRTISANHTIKKKKAIKKSIPADPSNQTTLPTIAKSILSTAASKKQSILPTTEQPMLRRTISANHTILTTAKSVKKSIPAGPSKKKKKKIAKFIISTAASTKQSILPTTEEPNLPTIKLSKQRKHRKRVRHRTRVPVSKATKTTTVMSTRNENHLNVSRSHLRRRTHHTTTAEKGTKEDVEMSQVASELEKELAGTNTEEAHAMKQNLKKKTTTTMKVFLQGSSRIPIPFPENNGFCHFHPDNALCGAF